MPTIRKKVWGRWMDLEVSEEELRNEPAEMPKPDPKHVNQSFSIHEANAMGLTSQQASQRMADEQYRAAMQDEEEAPELEPVDPNDLPTDANPDEGAVRPPSKK